MGPTKENILYKYRRYTTIFVLVFSAIGLVLDTLQQRTVISLWLTGQANRQVSFSSGNPEFMGNLHLIILNLVTLTTILILLIALIRRSISVSKTTIVYAVTLSLNLFMAYRLYFLQTDNMVSYVLRDLVIFFILIFIVATCTNTFFTVAIFVTASVFYIFLAILSKDTFLKENIPMFVMLTGAFAYVFRKIVLILEKSIGRQEEEAIRITELSRFKERMSHMLLHDIKVPMNSIIMLSHSPSSTSNIQKINYHASKVALMLGNILDVESGNIIRIKLSKSTFRLSDFIGEAIEQVHYHTLLKNITIQKNIPEISVPIYGDRNLLERCMVNIIDNAIKYSPENRMIEITGELLEDKISISVTDQGPGIDVSERDKIFELFYTIPENSGKGKSSGIGLTFCKMVVDAHDGNIAVHSDSEGGTKFTITLPFHTSLNENSILQVQDLSGKISPESLLLLKHHIAKLKSLKYYQLSEILHIFHDIPMNGNEQIRKEIEMIKEMALSCDENKFDNLLKILK